MGNSSINVPFLRTQKLPGIREERVDDAIFEDDGIYRPLNFALDVPLTGTVIIDLQFIMSKNLFKRC